MDHACRLAHQALHLPGVLLVQTDCQNANVDQFRLLSQLDELRQIGEGSLVVAFPEVDQHGLPHSTLPTPAAVEVSQVQGRRRFRLRLWFKTDLSERTGSDEAAD